MSEETRRRALDASVASGADIDLTREEASRFFAFAQPAPHGMRFRPGAFNAMLGQRVQLTGADGTLWPSGSGTLVAAEVSPDGSRVMFTVDLEQSA